MFAMILAMSLGLQTMAVQTQSDDDGFCGMVDQRKAFSIVPSREQG